MSTANRGKTAEAFVKRKLVSLESANTTHVRYPDARSGSFQVALADFLVLREGKLTLLEVKEVAHDYRLGYTNLSTSQISRLRMWKAAGANAHILVYHSTNKTWRAADVSWFFLNHKTLSDNGKPVGSWDMREVPLIGLDDYFSTFLGGV
jgi:penicillin-binding protein-related factor A (putative recombinase)